MLQTYLEDKNIRVGEEKNKALLKKLYLLRHAKADYGMNDLGRKLTAKGRRQAKSIGRWMSKNGIMPDRLISSPAKRTELTAKICCEWAGCQESIHFEEDLYDTSTDRYVAIIAGLNNKYDSVMIVGHNPTISAVVTILTGALLDMTPCMLVCIEIAVDKWISVKDADGILKWFHIPS